MRDYSGNVFGSFQSGLSLCCAINLRFISSPTFSSPLLPNPCANVILSSSPTEAGVAGSLGRLLLCRMAEFVQPENGTEGGEMALFNRFPISIAVFCTSRIGKEAALGRLANQFQKKLIVLVTTSAETRQLAKRVSGNGGKGDLPRICWPIKWHIVS